ncbi:ABC transporter permease [Streptomyces sp. MST-110588]|uniref:ABC transporter permease n=1 Tax=Streptomyces sp. MST-110588 TaxID=2833628 RepID=UPI001F5D458D|nr:ABC transporter permease [Streptomyces sp. MST-110588]UNO41613.1 ABC transporter permease [Streptomyces sp. MST-110588]
MFRTALRNVLAHKARLLMTVLAVMLGVAFVTGTLVFTSTVSDATRMASQRGLQSIDVAIEPAASGPKGGKRATQDPLTQGLLEKAGKVPGAAYATGTVSGFTAVADKNGELAGEGFSQHGRNYFPGPDGTDARYPLKAGAAPKGAGEIALDAGTAERAGYRVGDTVRISVDGPVRTVRLAGIVTTDDGAVTAGGTLTLFDTPTAQKQFAAPGRFEEIDVKAAPGTSQTELKAAVDQVLPKGVAKTTTARQIAEKQAEAADRGTSSLRDGMLGFAAISLFVGIFIIANTFTMLVAQRTKELALLRAVGASRRQVTRSVLLEATVVGAAAGVTGLVAGVGVGAGLHALAGSLGHIPDGPLVLAPATVLTGLLVGVLVTVLAAWLPSRRAAKIPPVAAMSSVHAAATTKSLVLRNSIGAALAGAGAAGAVVASGMGDAGRAVMCLAGALLVTGVFVLTPLLSRPLIAAAAPVLRAFGVAGKLARQNAVRNPRRTASTASALMIGLTLITGLTVVGSSVQRSLDEAATGSLKADYVVAMTGQPSLSPSVERTLAADPHVSATSPMRPTTARVAGQETLVTGVSGAEFGQLAGPAFTEGSAAGLGTPGAHRALVAQDTARRHGWKTGSAMALTYEDGRRGTLTVAGVFEGTQMLNGIIVDTSVLAPHQKSVGDRQVLVKTKDGASKAVRDSLRKALGSNPAIAVKDKKDLSAEVSDSVNLLLNMLYGLLAMAVVVAVLGVVNTLAMSVFERAQEIGMLRAIGLDQAGIKRMVRLESLVIALFGGVLGVSLGVFFGWAAGGLIDDYLPTYELVLPWGRLGIFLGVSAVVGVLAALWPARRATRTNMLAAIKAE